MDHKEIEQKEIVEKYALHKLIKTEEDAFEEHLLYCKKCRQALSEMENVIHSIKKSAQTGVYSNYSEYNKSVQEMDQKSINKTYLIRYPVAAAIIVILIALLAFYYAMDTFYSDPYEKSSLLENAIANRYRSEDLEVISPTNSKGFSQGQEISFIWQGERYKILNLILLNNRGEIVFETKIGPSYKLENELKKGLYYWQLETEEESVYIDKFYVR
jgi:hypothetical protein